MNKIKPTSIKEKTRFSLNGYNYEFIYFNEETGLYLYEATARANTVKTYDSNVHYFEIVRPIKVKFGEEVIDCYPGSESFGTYGKCTKYLSKAIEYLNKGW